MLGRDVMAECIAYVIDYSENKDFRKNCFQLLRHELEQKILSNAKCDISFVLSSIDHEELGVSNEFNYPGIFERILFCDSRFLLTRSFGLRKIIKIHRFSNQKRIDGITTHPWKWT